MQKKKKILLISSAPKDTIRQKALQKSLSDTFVLLSHSWTQKSEAQYLFLTPYLVVWFEI